MLRAFRYDGVSSRQTPVALYFDAPDRIRIVQDQRQWSYSLAEVEVAPRVANIRRRLLFPDASVCEVEDNDGLDKILKQARGRRFDDVVHHWESRLKYAVTALLITAGTVWATMEYGIPALARYAAFALPVSTEGTISKQSLAFMDKVLFAPSRLSDDRQAQIRKLFARIVAGYTNANDYRLEFRASPKIGANAFALPSGAVVITDELVKLAKHDEEIVAVLAHEIGHVRNRHTLRQILQDSVSGLLIAAVTGDVLSSTSFAAALPTMLVQTRFSRRFEIEADDFAVRYLKDHDIPRHYFSDILSSLTEAHHGDDASFLSTHPSTRDRIQRIGGDEN